MKYELEQLKKAAYGAGFLNPIDKVELKPAIDKDFDEITIEVTQHRPFSKRTIAEGGIFDVRLKEDWGYISLPLPVVNPVLLGVVAKTFNTSIQTLISHSNYEVYVVPSEQGALKISGSSYSGLVIKAQEDDEELETAPQDAMFLGNRMKGIVEALKLADSLFGYDGSPPDMLLSKWPVMPWVYRPFADYGWGFVLHPLNLLYVRLLMSITRMKKLQEKGEWEEVPAAYTLLQKAVYEIVFGAASYSDNSVTGTLSSLTGKEGVVRQRLLGQRIDYSGRAVIVPAPDLKIDEVYIPKKIAIDLFKPHLIKNIKQTSPNIEITHKLLEEWLFSVEGTPVLLNRQPTLHKYSIMGFKTKIWDLDVIGLHPLVVEPFNADMDGDTMAAWTAISEEGLRDIEERMMITKNLMLPDGTVYAVPRHDYLHGLWKLTRECTSRKRVDTDGLNNEELESLVDELGPCVKNKHGVTIGRELVSRVVGKTIDYEITKKTIHNLTKPVDTYLKIVDELKRLGRKFANESFSLKDLWELRPAKHPQTVAELDRDIKRLQKQNNPATNMVKSGSRGSWGQLQQMVSSKGYVRSPAGLQQVKSAYIDGLTPDEYWAAVHGSRASLVDKVVTIADPGYLARRLVMAATDQIVITEDCGSDGVILDKKLASGLTVIEDLGSQVRVRTPTTCKVEGQGICKKCANAELGDYLGVIAATTLSEPTTQLTLRVFHTGGEVGNVPVVSTISGKVIKIDHFIHTEKHKIYVPNGYKIKVRVGSEINKGDIVAVRVSSVGVTQDFGDLEALYELRSTGGLVATSDGILEVEVKNNKLRLRVGKKTYKTSLDKRVLKAVGEEVKAGDWLVDGVPNYKELYKELGDTTIELWLGQVRAIYEKNGVKVSSRDLLAIARAMYVNGEWVGIKKAMNEKTDIVLRLGAEAAIKAITGKTTTFDMSSEASEVLFRVPPYGSGRL